MGTAHICGVGSLDAGCLVICVHRVLNRKYYTQQIIITLAVPVTRQVQYYTTKLYKVVLVRGHWAGDGGK